MGDCLCTACGWDCGRGTPVGGCICAVERWGWRGDCCDERLGCDWDIGKPL